MSKVRLKQLDQDEISGFAKQVLSGDLSSISGSLTGLIYTGNTLSGNFSTLNIKVDVLSGQNTGISGRLDTIEQDFSAFSDQIDNFSGEMYGLSGIVNLLSGDLSFFSGNLVTAETDLASQSGRIDINSGNIISSSGALNSKISIVSGLVDSISGKQDITSGKVVSISGSLNTLSGNFTGFTGRYVNDYVLVCDSKASGTAGGTFTSGAWRTRDINTELFDDGSICTLSSNQIILSGGIYHCDISCPAWVVGKHKARLYNISSASVLLNGTSEETNNSGFYASTRSFIKGRIILPSTGAILEVQHIASNTETSDGFGKACTLDTGNNIYTLAEFRRTSV